MLLLLLLLPSALAGDPGPLCEAVASADALVEVTVTASGACPPKYEAKGWEPPDSAVQPTMDTAKVSRTLKGSADGWVATRADPGFGNKSAAWWKRFFSAGEFQVLVMLRRGEDGVLRDYGWIDDRGDCHVSWCWEALQAEMQAEARAAAPATP